MSKPYDFAPAIARCLAHQEAPEEGLVNLVGAILDEPDYPSRGRLLELQAKIELTPGASGKLALIYGGATKIKGYVFEAPKLPEIRGASALLDWVNELALPSLWGFTQEADLCEQGIVYSAGGNILAFAPESRADDLAAAIERSYIDHTLTANSVAVARSFGLLELRFGRDPLAYWVEQFEEDWQEPAKRAILERYYYYPSITPSPVAEGRLSEAQWRFYNRKTFGELVTVLAMMANRRRDEPATHGARRSAPLYSLIPWAAKCDSSDTRPAAYSGFIADETTPREISEATARKRYVGQLLKLHPAEQGRKTRWFRETFGAWDELAGLRERSWERLWSDFLEGHRDTPYSESLPSRDDAGGIRSAEDVGEIAQASSAGRYIGLIYADGDNVGRLIATLKTPNEYASTSEALHVSARHAVFDALAQHLRPAVVRAENGERHLVHPFEILTIGGDDLLVIVPGSKALPVALTIGARFEQRLAEQLAGRAAPHALASGVGRWRYGAPTAISQANYTPVVGLSAGVIIAQENAPIFFLRDLVEELQKSAKTLAKASATVRDGQAFYGGAVDFMVLKAVTMVSNDIAAFRRAALGDGSGRRLTARPYTWHEFAGLLDTAQALKAIRAPRSQLFRLRRSLDASGDGIAPSVMEYLYSRARLQKELAATLTRQFEFPWHHHRSGTTAPVALPPWMPREASAGWETLWPDLLEIYDMIETAEGV